MPECAAHIKCSEAGGVSPKRLALWPDVRERQVAALESLVGRSFEEAQADWHRLLSELGLDLWFYVPARLTVDAGSWRQAKHPYAWVAALTRRRARRLGLADPGMQELNLEPLAGQDAEATLDHLRLDLSKGAGGVWKVHTAALDDGDGVFSRIDGRWFGRSMDTGMRIDWDAVAQAAGLDELEAEVLMCRSSGLSRDVLLKTCQDEEERRDFQAAWRRLSGKLGRVKAVLRGRTFHEHEKIPKRRLPGSEKAGY